MHFKRCLLPPSVPTETCAIPQSSHKLVFCSKCPLPLQPRATSSETSLHPPLPSRWSLRGVSCFRPSFLFTHSCIIARITGVSGELSVCLSSQQGLELLEDPPSFHPPLFSAGCVQGGPAAPCGMDIWKDDSSSLIPLSSSLLPLLHIHKIRSWGNNATNSKLLQEKFQTLSP